MKKISKFKDSALSKAEMKIVTGGVAPAVHCEWTQCFGGDCFEMSGACAGSDPDECTWYITNLGGNISNLECCSN